MSDVFVSYSNSDRERVIPIVQLLGKQGWTVWWDRNIPPGKVFDRVIEEAIAATKCVLVVWSRASIESDWVKNEASEGVRRGIMIPVLIDNVQIPFEFRRIQAAKLTSLSPGSSGTQELLSSISNLIQRPAPETSATPAGPPPNSGVSHLIYKEGGPATDDTTSRTPTILVSSILVAVGLGSVFSFVYPTVNIDFDLAFLFMLVGLLIVLAIRGMWQAIWHKKK